MGALDNWIRAIRGRAFGQFSATANSAEFPGAHVVPPRIEAAPTRAEARGPAEPSCDPARGEGIAGRSLEAATGRRDTKNPPPS